MRTLKECILEKLKVSSNNYVNITYQEYYDLLDEYCKTNNEKFLDLGRMYDFNDSALPKYKNDKNKVIFTLTPLHSSSPILRLRMYNFNLQKSFSDNIYINDYVNKEVDFMEDEYIEATVKYMKEHIK